MSDHGGEAAAAPPGPKTSKLPLIFSLLNVLVVLGAMGALIYTKFLFKRPAITEQLEQARIARLRAAPPPVETVGLVPFDSVTINISSPGDRTGGKQHFATIGFALELRDMAYRNAVERVRPLIMDKLGGMVGRLQFQELNNVQGRYVLRSQLIEAANHIIVENAHRIGGAPVPEAAGAKEGGEGEGAAPEAAARAPAAEPEEIPAEVVSGVYFTQFMVQ